jgi:hypothetical protein
MGRDHTDSIAEFSILYRSGVSAVLEVAARTDEAEWVRPACGDWSAADTARHCLAVARWYHLWLDRSLQGNLEPPFPLEDMDDENEAALAALRDVETAVVVQQFEESAMAYLNRAVGHWDHAFAFPYGLVEVGEHAGLAASEWHVHAWDMSTVTERRYVPDEPAALFRAAGRGFAATEGGLRGRLLSAAVPLAARLSPWETLLKRSGRTP